MQSISFKEFIRERMYFMKDLSEINTVSTEKSLKNDRDLMSTVFN